MVLRVPSPLTLPCAVALLSLAATDAQAQTRHAEDQPKTKAHEYSLYEKESIRQALAETRAQVDPKPEGKTVEAIDIVTLEVVEKRDPVPGFLNVFHAKTRPYVIQREILLKPGDRYAQTLCDESARNLRRFHQLSLVACVPERGSQPDRVRILVITKDVWSLRLNTDFRYASGKLEYVSLIPSEENLLGTHQTAAALFSLYPLTYSLGGRYVIPRWFGSWVQSSAQASVIINRETGEAEGSTGSVGVSRPLYSTRTEWGWSVPLTWTHEITRQYVKGSLGAFNSKLTPQSDRIPFQYRSHLLSIGPSVTRSFGWALKHDVEAGVDVTRRQYSTFDLAPYDPVAAADFVRKVVPRSDNASGPYLQYRTYRTDFLRVIDFETLGLQEDFRLGHEFYARLYPSLQAIGSTRNLLGAYAGVQYTVPLGDGLARLGTESSTEFEIGDGATVTDGPADASLRVMGRVVTPRFGIGRLVVDGLVVNRYRNYLNRITFLGGEGRLRGYPTRNFYGKDVLVYNFEYRSRPVEILSCQIGATLFYDVGDAFDGFSDMKLKTSVGAGLRAMFPQLDRAVLRFDLGFPTTPGQRPKGFPGDMVVTFFQAFSVPSITPR